MIKSESEMPLAPSFIDSNEPIKQVVPLQASRLQVWVRWQFVKCGAQIGLLALVFVFALAGAVTGGILAVITQQAKERSGNESSPLPDAVAASSPEATPRPSTTISLSSGIRSTDARGGRQYARRIAEYRSQYMVDDEGRPRARLVDFYGLRESRTSRQGRNRRANVEY
jgi:hypothetical protein